MQLPNRRRNSLRKRFPRRRANQRFTKAAREVLDKGFNGEDSGAKKGEKAHEGEKEDEGIDGDETKGTKEGTSLRYQ